MNRTTLITTGAFAILLSGCFYDFPAADEGQYPCVDQSDCLDGYICFGDPSAADPGRHCLREDLVPPPNANPNPQPQADAGLPPPNPPIDAGHSAHVVDAGHNPPPPPADAGHTPPPADAGTHNPPPPDAGTNQPPPDAGTSNPPPPDAGNPVGQCTLTECGSECVDTMFDANHCGACGFSCGAGACNHGRCQPFTVFEAPTAKIRELELDGRTSELYWLVDSPNGAVMRSTLQGPPRPVAVANGVSYPAALAFDGDWVFWSSLEDTSSGQPGHIWARHKTLSSAPVRLTTTTQRSPLSLGAKGGSVYWTSNSPLVVRTAAARAPGVIQDYVPGTGSSLNKCVVTNDSHVYWLDSQANVFRAPLSLPTGTPERVTLSMGGEAGYARMLDGQLFWAEAGNALRGQGRIYRLDTAAGAPAVFVDAIDPADPSVVATGIDMDADWIYFVSSPANGGPARIWRRHRRNTDPMEFMEVSASGSRHITGRLVVVPPFAYWATTEIDSSGGRPTGRVLGMRLGHPVP